MDTREQATKSEGSQKVKGRASHAGMSYRDSESLYDYNYEDQDDEEPYLYSANNAYYEEDGRTEDSDEVKRISDFPRENDRNSDTIPHRLEDTVYESAPEAVPFYGNTTNKQEYTWKVPNPREKRASTPVEVEKVPFYSETTNRSQYVPIDMTVEKTRLSRRTSNLPTSNAPLETQTTYRNLFRELQIGKRQKLIHTCPAEKLIHQTSLLRNSRRENGHFFLPVQGSNTSLTATASHALDTKPPTSQEKQPV